VSDGLKSRGPWIIAAVVAGVIVARMMARRRAAERGAPADVAFMLALHSALRRDLSRLEDVASRADGTHVPSTVLAGWDAFRRELDNHHSAEDDDVANPCVHTCPSRRTWLCWTRWCKSTGRSPTPWTPSILRCAAVLS
jgi:hypothetical protein